MTVFRARVEQLRLPPNVPAGCNYMLIGVLAYQLRTSTGDLDPVTVRPEQDGGWSITDGRHRYLATVIAGRADLLCEAEATASPGQG